MQARKPGAQNSREAAMVAIAESRSKGDRFRKVSIKI
jgi:hypothetical protein